MSDAARGAFTLPPLPWSEGDLSPVISKNTIEFHYGKHHAAYVKNLNGLVAGTEMADMPIVDLIRSVHGDSDKQGVFNNAAQVWNHTFFWDSLSPAPTTPSQALLDKLNDTFGGIEEFQSQFAKAAAGQFGSGWAWLTLTDGKLAIETTPNAETPMAEGRTCLLTVDVWEHAYYLDYQNRRPDYLKAVIEKLLNWRFASDQFAAA
jgi:superoxide dismutase, Fe-Mn family